MTEEEKEECIDIWDEMMAIAQEMADEIDAMPKGGDGEDLHVRADELLIEALRILGADQLADAFEQAAKRVPFWYS